MPAASSASPPRCGTRHLSSGKNPLGICRPLLHFALPSSATGGGRAQCPKQASLPFCATPRRQNKGRLCVVMLTHNLARNHLFFLSEKISHTLLSFRVENTILLKLLKESSQEACGIVPTLCIII